MKKIITIALVSLCLLGVNAQAINTAQKEIKKVEQAGVEKIEQAKEKLDATKGKVQDVVKRSKDKLDATKGKAVDKVKGSKDKVDATKDRALDKINGSKDKLNATKEVKDNLQGKKERLENIKDDISESKSVEELKANESKVKTPTDAKINTSNIKDGGANKAVNSGKEFGKERAMQAKADNRIKIENLVKSVSSAETKLASGTAKVAAAKLKLEADKLAGLISVEQYVEKAKQILNAETLLNKLSEKVSLTKLIK